MYFERYRFDYFGDLANIGRTDVLPLVVNEPFASTSPRQYPARKPYLINKKWTPLITTNQPSVEIRDGRTFA